MGQNSSKKTKCDDKSCHKCIQSTNNSINYDKSDQQMKKWPNYEFNSIDYLCNDENREAIDSIKRNNYERALHLYRNSRNSNSMINLSFCLYSMQRYEESLISAKQAIDFCDYDNKPKAYFRCAEALVQLNRFEESVKMFEKVLVFRNDCKITQNRIAFAKNQMIGRQKAQTNGENNIAVNRLSAPLMPNNSQVIKPNTSQSDVLHFKANNFLNQSSDKTDANQRNFNQRVIPSEVITKQGLNQKMTKSYSTEKINSNYNQNKRQNFNKRVNRSPKSKLSFSQEDIHRLNRREGNGFDIKDIDNSIGVKVKNEIEALKVYTTMISVSETDYRLFINRSFYHYFLGNYELALDDAKQAICLRPEEPKAYYRAGLALKALGNLNEAELMLVKVLQILPNNDSVNNELVQIRCKALRKMGFDEETSLNVALNTNTIQDSYQDVLTNNRKSDQINALGKPTNPLKLNALKVRNVNSDTKLGTLYKIFGKFGEVEKIFFDRSNHCCFVNYSNDESPIEAIATLYDFKVREFCHNDRNPWLFGLIPDRQQRSHFEFMSKFKMKKIINDCGECDDWRLRDCLLRDKCPLKHIPINKGIETLLSRRVKK